MKSTKKTKIVLTGGGTGGHAYPAISIGQAIRRIAPHAELLYIGSESGPEKVLAENEGIPFSPVTSAPMTRMSGLSLVTGMGRLASGVVRARQLLADFGASVVVGTGGYTTAPVILAQRLRGGKVLLHDGDAMPGKVTRLFSRFADHVCASHECALDHLPAKKSSYTGMPVRDVFLQEMTKEEAREKLGISSGLFTVLVVGGSQGAVAVNDLFTSAWSIVSDGSLQAVHQIGRKNMEEGAFRAVDENHHVYGYIDMPLALAASDLVIGRAGASTTAEIAVANLPAILIPYPYAASDHQLINANYIAGKGAAVVCDQFTTTPEALSALIRGLVGSPEELDRMSRAAASMARPQAADEIAHLALRLSE